MENNRNISYLNKDFNSFKANLINYIKTYFPNTYNDFSEASPGMMFTEMSAYVGDVLSFYLDNQFQENILLYTKEKSNIMAMAYTLGYRPKVSYASSTMVDLFQLLPVSSSAGVSVPDFRYALIFDENTTLSSNFNDQKFLTTEVADFSETGSVEISIYNNDYFLAKKSVKAISGEIVETSFTFGAPTKFTNVTIADEQILQILSVTGSDGSIWYEVPYLAQETIFQRTSNPNYTSDNVPYLLSLQKVPKRFVTRFQADGSLRLEFGAGLSNTKTDSQIIPVPDATQLGLVPSISNNLENYNKASIFFTREYGIAPSNISLNVRYLVGGGIESNIDSNLINNIISLDTISFKQSPPNVSIGNIVRSLENLSVNNPIPATGGRSGDTVDEIRLNTLNAFSAQNRTVTREDYMTRALSMPSIYGSISKVYVLQDLLIDNDNIINNNPLSLSLYVLGYDSNKKIISASTTLKNNLKTYLSQYKMATDSIIIKDAYYINLGLNFDITTLSGYNNKDVITNCISALKDYFAIEKWQINQPIAISDVYAVILKVKGVLSVSKIEFVNKQSSDGMYSVFGYDINAATRNNIIYPSLDPSIFEIRYPDLDIKGRVVYL